MKLTSAIQGGDYPTLVAALQRIGLTPATYLVPGGNLLHVIASFGVASLIPELLKAGVKINEQNAEGDTPLHVASRYGRLTVLDQLLPQPELDDTIVNKQGLTAYHVAKNRQIATAIEYSRSIYINAKTREMHKLVSKGDVAGLKALFENHRNKQVINVDSPDSHGDTILHVAAKHDNAGLVQACLDLGADAFFKNKKNKLPIELTKDDQVKAVLKDAPMRMAKGLPSSKTRMEAYLSKWTNYAEGYKLRWFVLEDGILSYYKSQAEYPVNCRGSINMQYAKVQRHDKDKLRFEVAPLGRGAQKMHIRVDNVIDVQRWIIALEQASAAALSASQQQEEGGDQVKENAALAQGKELALSSVDTFPEMLKGAVNSLSELEIILDEQLPREHVDATIKYIFRVREALLAAEERERTWRRKWEHERAQKGILEESFRELAAENARLERFTRLKAAEVAQGKTLLDESVSIEQVTDEFYDALEMELYAKPAKAAVAAVSIAIDTAFIAKELVGYAGTPRSIIPCDSTKMPPISLWSILKNAIGKDLSRMPIPVNYSEPVSMLQRLCEEMEYSELLDMACAAPDPLVRVQYVAAFAASSYASTDGRVTKPFNPLMGETFEFVSAARGFRYVAEQVSHHPPISACHCESSKYTLWAEVRVGSRFWGKSMELTPEGMTHLVLKGVNGGADEHYSWKKVKTSVNNIVVGRLWIDHYGLMAVTCHESGVRCELDFKATGWRTVEPKRIEGCVLTADGEQTHSLTGFWNAWLSSKDLRTDEEVELWRRNPVLPDAPAYYSFSAFTMALNELKPELSKHLCPTDSRLRPDQRAMEEGNFDGANKLKVRLEEKQRAARKLMEMQKGSCRPRWFRRGIEGDTGLEHWEFDGAYWRAREAGDWDGVPRIFLD